MFPQISKHFEYFLVIVVKNQQLDVEWFECILFNHQQKTTESKKSNPEKTSLYLSFNLKKIAVFIFIVSSMQIKTVWEKVRVLIKICWCYRFLN
jgi:hypothetical protein